MLIAGAGDVQWGTVSQWVSAAATFAAVLVALSGPVRARSRRPRLRLEVSRTEPHVRITRPAGEIAHEGFYIRVAVWNHGKSAAERVRVQINRWVYRALDDDGWTSHDLDPAVLHWTGMPYVDQGRTTPPEVSIAAGAHWFFDLAACDVRKGQTRLVLDDRTSRGFDVRSPHYLGDFVAEVLVSAGNATPVAGRIAWTIDGKRFVSCITLVSRMPDAPLGGLLNILNRDAGDE